MTSSHPVAAGLAAFAERWRLFNLRPGNRLPGGEFAGVVYDNGAPSLLILGPEYDGQLTWPEATAWAKSLNVDDCTDFFLPLRPHGRILQAHLGDRFKPSWYWLGEQHAGSTGYAWYQYFGYGYQYYWGKDGKLWARAVRRLALYPFIHSPSVPTVPVAEVA